MNRGKIHESWSPWRGILFTWDVMVGVYVLYMYIYIILV